MEEKFVQTMQESKGKFITFRQDKVLLANGHHATRDIVLHRGAVAVVAVSAQKEIILVRQYRYAVGEALWELPAGKLEEGEDPLLAAKRELSEETGFQAALWQYLTAIYTAPGFASEKLYLYLAEDLAANKAHPDEDELIEYRRFPLSEAYEMIVRGEIKDAKTVSGILMYLKRA